MESLIEIFFKRIKGKNDIRKCLVAKLRFFFIKLIKKNLKKFNSVRKLNKPNQIDFIKLKLNKPNQIEPTRTKLNKVKKTQDIPPDSIYLSLTPSISISLSISLVFPIFI